VVVEEVHIGRMTRRYDHRRICVDHGGTIDSSDDAGLIMESSCTSKLNIWTGRVPVAAERKFASESDGASSSSGHSAASKPVVSLPSSALA
jgi:hypothetical protein